MSTTIRGLLAFVTTWVTNKDQPLMLYCAINVVVNNNHKNFGAPDQTVAGIPSGTGILIMRRG